MGEKFYKYKQEIITLREAAEKHLNSCISSIEAGLPEVAREKMNQQKRDIKFLEIAKNKNEWMCKTCKDKNSINDKKCRTCG